MISQSLALWIVTSSLAAAGADTWATAVGAWSRTRRVTSLPGRQWPPALTAASHLLGCLGALAGAGLVAGSAAWIGREPGLAGAALAIGFGGMLADSALGATLPGRFRCPECAQPSEWRVHRCGAATVPTGGLVWLNNDGVNALATGTAALAGWCVWAWLAPGFS